MSNFHPAATFLSHFEPEVERPVAARPSLRTMLTGVSDTKSPKQQINDAFERGVAEGRLAALQECEALHADRLAVLKAAHAAERAAWVSSEGENLRKGLAEGLRTLEERIATSAVAVLEPFIEQAVVIKAREDLLQRLKIILSDGKGWRISARGRKDLLDYLKAVLPENVDPTLEATDGELTVSVADTVLHTALTEWIEELRRTRNG